MPNYLGTNSALCGVMYRPRPRYKVWIVFNTAQFFLCCQNIENNNLKKTPTISGILLKMFSIIKGLISISGLNISLCSSLLGDYNEIRIKQTSNLLGDYVAKEKKFWKGLKFYFGWNSYVVKAQDLA